MKQGQFNYPMSQRSYLITLFFRVATYNKSKKEGKDRESIQSSTTADPGYQWESDNVTIRRHKRDPRGQPFPCRSPQGINKQTCSKA